MEKILRDKEIFKIIPFDETKPVLYFPIRHHSPVCSYHLRKTIESYQPDCILVEGPQNANHLIPVLTDEETILPIAFYYFYKDVEKAVSEEAAHYKCYYPFLETSPEYQALREAKKRGIQAKFIDLPYGEILTHTAQNTGLRIKRNIQSYNDDYYLSENDIRKQLCEKTGMRHFDEFWENFFEIDGLAVSTEEFVARMMSYCYLSRNSTPTEQMEADGCLVREQYMAVQIKKALKEYQRVLVVTGGFHTPGLYEYVNGSEKLEEIKLHLWDENTQNVYAIPYSLEAADALNGYASGMQNPGFYEAVWQKLEKSHEGNRKETEAYKETVLDMLLRCGKAAGKERLLVTMADIASAAAMYEGLAMLRDKKAPGLYELYDSVTSCFVKGEKNAVSDQPVKILSKLATGDKVGTLCHAAGKSPLIEDFERHCEQYKLKIQSVIEKKLELDIYAKPRHMEISRFFHRINFLGTQFAIKIKGFDIVENTDRSRVRELWKYKRSVQTDAALIDATVYGATVEEACKVILANRLQEVTRCRDAAKLYVESFLMGLDDSMKFARRMEEIIFQDGDFFSLGKGIYYFRTMMSLKRLYRIKLECDIRFLKLSFQKLLLLLPSMIHVDEDQSKECIKIFKMLYSMAAEGNVSEVLEGECEQLIDSFTEMIQTKDPEASVYGAILGMLYGEETSYKSEIQNALRGYLTGSETVRQQGAAFLRGLFYTARDMVLVGDEFIRMTDTLLASLPAEEFMEVLPELRLAFSYFLPAEIDKVAEKVSLLYGKQAGTFTKVFQIYEETYPTGIALEKEICADMEKEGKLS